MYERELAVAVAAAKEASAAVRDLYDRSAAESYVKGDGSMVTDADLAADRIIRANIAAAFPADAILTEEGADDQARLANSRCWIVDPIDGTNQFIERTGEFDVLIGLAVDGEPVVGVMLQPSTGLIMGASRGSGAWVERNGKRESLQLSRLNPSAAPAVMTSLWMGAPANLPTLRRISERLGGSEPVVSGLGINLRRMSAPQQDADVIIGYREDDDESNIAWEWDFAAPEVIVTEAGGVVSDLKGNPHRYNKPVPRNLGGIILSVDPALHEQAVAAVKPEISPARS